MFMSLKAIKSINFLRFLFVTPTFSCILTNPYDIGLGYIICWFSIHRTGFLVIFVISTACFKLLSMNSLA
jgi:hypothetical protein